MKKCYLCKSSKRDETKYGEFLTKPDMSVHYFCLLLTSNLIQAGNDDEGFFGFMTSDIKAEAQRISSAICTYCKERSANISCCATKCRRTFHTVCGLENGTESEFIGTFKSFCDRHVRCKKSAPPKKSETCCICFDDLMPLGVKFSPVYMLKAPCCKNGWFHKWCLASFAKTAGYFFKCPLCNDSKIFRDRLVYKGIFIPDRDAAWEIDTNAFAELLERPSECLADNCMCKKGRKESTPKNPLITCNTCGSVAFHKSCLKSNIKIFTCTDCQQLLSNVESGKRRHSNIVYNGVDGRDEESEEIDVCNVSGDDVLELDIGYNINEQNRTFDNNFLKDQFDPVHISFHCKYFNQMEMVYESLTSAEIETKFFSRQCCSEIKTTISKSNDFQQEEKYSIDQICVDERSNKSETNRNSPRSAQIHSYSQNPAFSSKSTTNLSCQLSPYVNKRSNFFKLFRKKYETKSYCCFDNIIKQVKRARWTCRERINSPQKFKSDARIVHLNIEPFLSPELIRIDGKLKRCTKNVL